MSSVAATDLRLARSACGCSALDRAVDRVGEAPRVMERVGGVGSNDQKTWKTCVSTG
jgi:hypothetical protein